MTKLEPSVRVTGIHFDYATWHAHLAARGTPSRLVVVPRTPARHAARTGRILHLSLATWEARLAGATRRAA
jgi:hypothetical protein